MWVIESLVGRVRQPSQRVRCFFALKMRRYAIGHVKDVAVEGVKVNFDGLNAAVLTLIGRFGGPLLSAQTVNASSALCRCDSSSQTDAHRRRPRMSVSADCAASHHAPAFFTSRSVRSPAPVWHPPCPPSRVPRSLPPPPRQHQCPRRSIEQPAALPRHRPARDQPGRRNRGGQPAPDQFHAHRPRSRRPRRPDHDRRFQSRLTPVLPRSGGSPRGFTPARPCRFQLPPESSPFHPRPRPPRPRPGQA